MPPSTRMMLPLVKLDASDAKNSAAPTISGGLLSRCSVLRADLVVADLVPEVAELGAVRFTEAHPHRLAVVVE
jgi:hypothetical protein